MGKIRFELDLAGLNELMKSDEMQSVLKDAARTVAANAESMAVDKDAKYTYDVITGRWVAIARVHAEGAAMRENYAHNTLVKALGSAGLDM